MSVMRRKLLSEIKSHEQGRQLVRSLRWPHLIALGIGAIVGTGIYTLIGVGVFLAGPGLLLSFLIAGAICACTALAYVEMSTLIPVSGSAYTYSYVAIGEPVAWVVGWSLILEYSLVVSTAAVGWSGYFVGFLQWVYQSTGWDVRLPTAISAGPHAGGLVNVPAIFITFGVAGLLMCGTRGSALLNGCLVIMKLLALVLFVSITIPHFHASNLHPFLPYGLDQHVGPDHVKHGVMAAAAIVFFAFYGFDAISTAAEETKEPGRDLGIGIVGSMIGCTLIYICVGFAAIGAMHYTQFANSEEPLALILRSLNLGWAAALIGIVAVIALPTVLLAFMFGQSRIFFVMSRDGLLPHRLSAVNPRTGTPVTMTLITALLVAALAGVARLDEIAALANAGTLAAFSAVSVSMLVMRVSNPKIARVFRAPCAWILGPIAIGGCIYLFFNLPSRTQLWFGIWNLCGVIIYVFYGRHQSHQRKLAT